MQKIAKITHKQTIVALSTPMGMSALGLVRLSGMDALAIADSVFQGKPILNAKGYSMHFGKIADGNKVLDEVMLSVFKAPKSFTGEDVVEICCHGSVYILQEVIQLLISKGARMAEPGEFTMRGFKNGKFDLLKAEAITDLIHSESSFSHAAAMNMLKGTLSDKLKSFREMLISFSALLELELDFSEEDVEFASRDALKERLNESLQYLKPIIESFKLGNAIKKGIPVVIAGKPNAGKSTLLNQLLEEEKAIVTNIPGTTRDIIEDVIHIEGIQFRFIDTAGLRESEDVVESLGIQKAIDRIKTAQLVLYVFDAASFTDAMLNEALESIQKYNVNIIPVANKTDLPEAGSKTFSAKDLISISAKNNKGIKSLKTKLIQKSGILHFNSEAIVLTNIRHFESLTKVKNQLELVLKGIETNLTSDLLAEELRVCIYYFGEVTGEITNNDILDHIFSKFCIGK